VCGSCSNPHGCVGITGVHPVGLSHSRMGGSLLLSPLLSGKRGACNGSNVHHHGENLNAESKSPFLAHQMSKWFVTLPPVLLQEHPAEVR
jgi:hypothetical protein